MKKIGAIVGVLLVTAAVANAAITADSVKLQINTSTGQAYLINTGTDTIPLCGYYVKNSGSLATMNPIVSAYDPVIDDIIPVWDTANTWTPIYARSLTNPTHPISSTILGSSSGWGPLSNTTSYLGEVKQTGTSLLKPSATLPIGHITSSIVASDFQSSTAVVGKFTWQYKDGTNPTQTLAGPIEIVPEPATMSLLVIGGIATLIRRRR